MTILLIDGGYYICYRLFATLQWWNLARREDDPEEHVSAFKSAFEDRFLKSLPEFLKKYKISPRHIVMALDQKVKDLWRTDVYPDYKKGRTSLLKHQKITTACFEKSTLTNLCMKLGVQTVQHPRLEADDCIFILSKHINSSNTIILTNDNDYLQIPVDFGRLLNLKGQSLRDRSHGSPEIDLRVKILSGDKSDNIAPIFDRCGPKTALRIIKNPKLLENKKGKLGDDERHKLNERIKTNTTLIDFNEIPSIFVDEFMEANQNVIESLT